MCIIAAKPAGIPMPEEDTLRAMWEGNPDGAGFMFPDKVEGKHGKGKSVVRVEKGFMTFDNFLSALNELAKTRDLTATPVVMHFRITTHGGTCPELTHPFPVTDSRGALRKLSSAAPVGIAHNGIIRSVTPAKDMSDTSEYVATQLAPLHKALPRFWECPHALELIRNAIGSKMAILSADGAITTIGEFNEHNGVLYSNYSWQPRTWIYSTYDDGAWSGYAYGGALLEGTATARLMNLSDVPGAYVHLDDGTQVDTDYNDSYAIDAALHVYEYDGYLDVWVKLSGASAYASTGRVLAYQAKAATWEDTITEDDMLMLYSELEDDESLDGAGLPPF